MPTQQKCKTEKVITRQESRLKMWTCQKYKWENSLAKKWEYWDWNRKKYQIKHLLVHTDGWTVQKKSATWTKDAKTTWNYKFPICK